MPAGSGLNGLLSEKNEQSSEQADSDTAEYKTEAPSEEPITTKEQAKETPQEVAKSSKLQGQIKKTTADTEDKTMHTTESPGDIIKQTALAMGNNDPEIRLDMMESLAGEELPDPSVLPVISQGLKDQDERVREAAVRALSFVNTPEADKLLIESLNDTNEDVRRTALEAASEQEDKARWDVLQSAIASSYKDVKEDAVANLIGLSKHNTINILISGLKDPDADFRQEVNSALDLLISKEFGSYDEAVKWWNENKNNYDDELFEKETAQ